MKIAPDTNVLVRAIQQDDAVQGQLAADALRDAEQIILTQQSLCEFVWVMRSRYRRSRSAIASAIRDLIKDPKIVTDRYAVAAGLEFLDSNGDFADGIIAFDGRRMADGAFVTFDSEAAAIASAKGYRVTLLT